MQDASKHIHISTYLEYPHYFLHVMHTKLKWVIAELSQAQCKTNNLKNTEMEWKQWELHSC